MTVSGTGYYTVSSPDFRVGMIGPYGAGNGTASINGAAGGLTATFDRMEIGLNGYIGSAVLTNAGGAGSVNLTSENASAPGDYSSGTVRVGNYGGTGTLSILAGATLISNNAAILDPMNGGNTSGGYNNVNIGRGGTGTVNVNGTGSFLGAYGIGARVTAGRDAGGDGTLNILNGGTVGSLSMVVGRGNGATGTLNVNGTGSTLNLNDSFGVYGTYNGNDYSPFMGGLNVARDGGSTGMVNITNGGTVNVFTTAGVTEDPYINIGRDNGDAGEITVSGAGSSLNVTANGPSSAGDSNSAFVGVGRNGQGTLTVESGADVTISGPGADLRLGGQRGGNSVDGLENLLEIKSGGTVTVSGDDRSAVIAGFSEGASDRIEVNGPTSSLNVIAGTTTPGDFQFITLGLRGSAELNVSNGGSVLIDGEQSRATSLLVGRGSDDGTGYGTGVATVTGAGSSITLRGSDSLDFVDTAVVVGFRGNSNGTLNILDGGVIDNSTPNGAVVVADGAGSIGFLSVVGAGSRLEAGRLLAVGVDVEGETGVNDTVNGGLGGAFVRNGGTVVADEILIGERGSLIFEGEITGDVELHGSFFVSSMAPGGDPLERAFDAAIVGDFTHETEGNVGALIGDFASGVGNTISISGSATFLTSATNFTVETYSSSTILAGDVYTFATATGGLTAANSTITDSTLGIDYAVSSDGTNLLLTALEDSLPQTATINGGGIDDTLNGTAAAELIDGLAGNDTLRGRDGNDLLYGREGNDILIAGDGDDRVLGGDGIDRIQGQNGNDRLDGEGGNDIIIAGFGMDSLTGGDGNDTLNGNSDDDSIDGGDGADVIFGGANDDVVFGGADNDRIFGQAGIDEIDGGTGDDTINGGNDDDTINGGIGDDLIFGSNQNDQVMGDAGNDVLNGGNGDDTLRGGLGNDTLQGSFGADALYGDNGNDSIQSGDGDDRLFGGSNNDILRGVNGNDRLFGQNGNDSLTGDNGNDTLNGGLGIDTLRGGDGNDTLTGGTGNDRFNFLNGWDNDIITDFANNGIEKIDLRAITGVSSINDLTITTVGGNAQIAYAGNTITVNGLVAADLDAADFLL